MNEIILSLKPQFANLIVKRKKNHEFRSRVPKRTPKRIWIYVTTPVAMLMYMAEIDHYIETPEQITTKGIGNSDFNTGQKSKYAYPIKHLYKLKTPVPLKELRTKYSFFAPQGFAYMEKYPQIKNDLEQQLIPVF